MKKIHGKNSQPISAILSAIICKKKKGTAKFILHDVGFVL